MIDDCHLEFVPGKPIADDLLTELADDLLMTGALADVVCSFHNWSGER